MALFTSKKTAVITAEKVLQYWSQTVVEQLIKTCVSLKKLSLENCLVTDQVCKFLSEQNHKTLTTLHMAMVTGLSKVGLESIVRLCQNLEELNIAWCNLSEDTFDSICSTNM